MEKLDFLVNHSFFPLGVFIVGTLIAIVLYLLSKKDKIPCYEIVSNTIIEGLHNALEGLEIQYKSVIQKRITVTKVIFWNAGRETIDGTDLVKKII